MYIPLELLSVNKLTDTDKIKQEDHLKKWLNMINHSVAFDLFVKLCSPFLVGFSYTICKLN